MTGRQHCDTLTYASPVEGEGRSVKAKSVCEPTFLSRLAGRDLQGHGMLCPPSKWLGDILSPLAGEMQVRGKDSLSPISLLEQLRAKVLFPPVRENNHDRA